MSAQPFYDGGGSAVKSMAFFLLFAGLLLIAIGYIRSNTRCPPPRVEFRYVPRTFEQEQNTPVPVLSVFGRMFQDRDPWQRDHFFVDWYPWEQSLIDSKVVHPYHDMSGLGRSVGHRVL
jgi:hypothetical protein